MSYSEQTGNAGAPSSPFRVSTVVAGAHPAAVESLRLLAVDLRGRLEALSPLETVPWGVSRWTIDGRARTWAPGSDAGSVDAWTETLDGFPARFDRLSLQHEWWGGMTFASPQHPSFGEPVTSVSGWRIGDESDSEAASSSLLDVLRVAAGLPGAATGFVHVDSAELGSYSGMDLYGELVSVNGRLGEDRFVDQVHGYNWAVLLKAGHIDRLGGVAAVRRDSPCAHVEQLDHGGVSLLCRVTTSPFELDAERVMAWRAYLRPLLRSGFPGPSSSFGPRGSFRRPIWLFEGPPVPQAVSIALRLQSPDGVDIETEWSDSVQDPEQPTVWLYLAAGEDEEHDRALVRNVVLAWTLLGQRGALLDVDGELGRVSIPSAERDDEGTEALVWDFDPGAADPMAALRSLTDALSALAASDELKGGVLRLRIA